MVFRCSFVALSYGPLIPRQENVVMPASEWVPGVAGVIARNLPARITAMQIGPVAFFTKPFDDEKFLAAVRDALNLAKRS